MRILVLGAGEAADELRRQASEAGAELAQRFSARVTHVVVEPELAADDPRVAKALAADLPVLTLAECVQLLGFGEPIDVGPAMIPAQPVTVVSSVAPVTPVMPVTPVTPDMPELPMAPGMPLPSAQDGAVAPAELQLASEMQLADATAVSEKLVSEVSAAAEASVSEVPAVEVLEEVGDERAGAAVEGIAAVLTTPAEPETVESTVDDAASDDIDADVETEVDDFADEAASCSLTEAPVPYSPMEAMLGSALEAALLFPPLPVSPGDSLDSDAGYQSDFYVTEESKRDSGAGEVGLGEEAGVSAELAEEADGCNECSEHSGVGAGLMGSDKSAALEAGGDEDEDDDEEDDEDEDEGLDVEVSDLLVDTVGAGNDRARTIASYAWAAVPFASLGLLTPIAMGYAAYRQRSRALAAVTAWYLLAISIAFVVSAAASGGTQPQSAVGDLLTICLAASWIGGTVHALLIRRQVFGKSK